MIDEKIIRNVGEEAVRLNKDNPELGYKEAIELAKESYSCLEKDNIRGDTIEKL